MTHDALPHSPFIVIKVGGSLLSLPDLSMRLQWLLNQVPRVRPLFLAGGGRIVDEIRNWDATFSLGEETSHVLAMDALHVTAGLLAHVIPSGRLVENREEAESCWLRGEVPVLQNLTAHSGDLPRTWNVTSDSLAAEVAKCWLADELWLLKSADLPAGITFAEACRLDLIDRHFPQCAADVRGLMWCNLRHAEPRLQVWS